MYTDPTGQFIFSILRCIIPSISTGVPWLDATIATVGLGLTIAAAAVTANPVLIAAAIGGVTGGAAGALSGGLRGGWSGAAAGFLNGAATGAFWGAVWAGVGMTGMYMANIGMPNYAQVSSSTGRTSPNNLYEQLAMKQVQSNPLEGAVHLKGITLNDPRWPASAGWQKMQVVVKNGLNKSTIHYVYNPRTNAFYDFKFC